MSRTSSLYSPDALPGWQFCTCKKEAAARGPLLQSAGMRIIPHPLEGFREYQPRKPREAVQLCWG